MTSSPLTLLVPDRDGLRAVAERTFRAPRADVWAALTRVDRLTRWLGTCTGDLTAGGRYRITFGDDAEDQVTGAVLACVPPEHLVVTWVLPDGHASEVEITLTDDGDATALRLEHRGLPAASVRGYAAGWHVHLDDLGRLLTGATSTGSWDERFDAVLPTYRTLVPWASVTRGERNRLRFERHLATDLADAWTLVSDPERIARWFAPVSVEGDAAGTARGWATYWDDGQEYATGTIRRCEPPHVVEVTWTASDDTSPASADSVLRVTLTATDDGVLLVLEHEGLGDEDLVTYGAGWHAYLDRLGDGSVRTIDWSAHYRQVEPGYRALLR